jgi:hypothetical protein
MPDLTIDLGGGESVNVTLDVGPLRGLQGIQGVTGASYSGTSTTSITIGTGSTTFATQAGLAYVVGSRLRLASAGTPNTWMEGNVTAYSLTTMTFLATKVSGSGTHADWNLSLAGEPGADGTQRTFGGSYAGGIPTITPTADAATADDWDSPYNRWVWNGSMWGPPFV